MSAGAPSGCGLRAHFVLHSRREGGFQRGSRCRRPWRRWRRWRGSRLCGEPAFSPAGAAGGGCGPAALSQVSSETRSGRRKGPQPQPPHSSGILRRAPRFPEVSAAPGARPLAFRVSPCPGSAVAPLSPCPASRPGSGPCAVLLGGLASLPYSSPLVPQV